MFLFTTTIEFFITLIFFLIMVAFFTYFERKLMALLQRRFGPNIAGFNGLLQPIVDGVKAITKEQVVPNNSNKFLFFLSPIFAFSITMGYLAIIPFGTNLVISNINLGLLYIFGLSSLSLYPIVLSG